MKTISIRLEDSIYEELGEMLDAMGQTKQTFYETFTRTALRERSIPFIIKAPLSDTHKNNNSKLEAFARLEASRKAATEAIDYDVDREEAMNEKYAKFSLSQLRHRQRSLMQLKKIPSRLLRIVCRINVQRMSEQITLSPAM